MVDRYLLMNINKLIWTILAKCWLSCYADGRIKDNKLSALFLQLYHSSHQDAKKQQQLHLSDQVA